MKPLNLTSAITQDGMDISWNVHGVEPASPNKMRGAHWSIKKKDRDNYTLLARAARIPALRIERFSLICFRTYRGRPLDLDNLAACFKPAIDALVDAHLLADDRPENCIDVRYQQAKREKGDKFGRFSITVLPRESKPAEGPAPKVHVSKFREKSH